MYDFTAFVKDVFNFRRRKNMRIAVPRRMVLAKSQAVPTSETREYTRAELMAKYDDVLNRTVDALKNGEISAVQVSEIEARVNRAIAQMKAKK